MTPEHLAQNDESPQDAASDIATAAATTTATMVGEVGYVDRVDGEFAEEDHGDVEVGIADPVQDVTANEDHVILSNSYNWIIEGVEDLDDKKIRHMNAFYALLTQEVVTRQGIHIQGHHQGGLQ